MASDPKPSQKAEPVPGLDTAGAESTSLRRELRDARDRLIASAIVSESLLKQVCAEANRTILTLSKRAQKAESELEQIKGSVGWRLLSQYGRFKYAVVVPLLRILGLRRASETETTTEAANAKNQTSVPGPAETGRAIPPPKVDGGAKRCRSSVGSPLKIDPVVNRLPLPAHEKSVDIAVCVHDALDETTACLDSLVRHTRMPYTIIIVDDGSGPDTRHYLEDFSKSQGAALLRNEEARGYTRAANQALRQSKSDYVVLLNSDTVVTPSWVDRLIACAESDERIGIVGPLSNVATWQSVPEIFASDTTDWIINTLLAGDSPADAARAAGHYSARLYPEMPFLNGFCYLVKRALINDIGIFDEESFGEGYGEENDYCLRAAKAGWKRVLADDAYVWHHETRSYTAERKTQLTKRSDDLLVTRYGSEVIDPLVAVCHRGRVIEGIRARSRVIRAREESVETGKRMCEGKRVLFILPIAECNGGGNVVIGEASAMRRMGVDARIVNLARHRKGFEEGYPGLDVPISFVEGAEDIGDLVNDYDAVVATFHDSVFWLDYSQANIPRVKRAYYVQDFEPYFNPVNSPAFHHGLASYVAYEDLIRIVKSEWNRGVIKDHTGADSFLNGPAADIDLFRPRPRKDKDWPARPLRILAMIRPMTPRRSPLFTLQVLGELKRERGDEIEIILFGCEPDDAEFDALLTALPYPFPFQNAGILTRDQTAALMNEVDVFCDLSFYQALGLTALEAMACGVAVVAPARGGASSFIKNEINGLLVDTGSREACAQGISRLIARPELRAGIQRAAIYDACEYFPERSALRMLQALFNSGGRV